MQRILLLPLLLLMNRLCRGISMVVVSMLCLKYCYLFLFHSGRVDDVKGDRNSKRKRREEVEWRNGKSFSTDACASSRLYIHLKHYHLIQRINRLFNEIISLTILLLFALYTSLTSKFFIQEPLFFLLLLHLKFFDFLTPSTTSHKPQKPLTNN